jgi:polyhydroxyalkanoate synthase subunit PhaC
MSHTTLSPTSAPRALPLAAETSLAPPALLPRKGFAANGMTNAEALDAAFHARAAQLSSGLSPISLALATTDWALHLATQPAQTWQLFSQAQQGALRWWSDVLGDPQLAAGGEDHRFEHPGWQQWPLAPIVRAYLGAEDWWRQASVLRGMTRHHQDMTRVFAHQWLDLMSPANLPWLNPEVVERTLSSGGLNLLQGTVHALDDWRRDHGMPPLQPPERPFQPGVDVAITPGRVVHRNHLVELIQYSPSTPSVQAEPVFIVPSWIMKYYILDLSPPNSMVRWLVSQGHTVFMLSWRNPDESDALIDMADYLQLGVFDPLAAIARLVPGEAVHAAGYCLGGTLLAIGAAALARPGQVQGAELLPPLASISLLAAETDFSEPGEMGVLIDESQVAMLEDMMAEHGYLTGRQMAGSFQFLHARELVWSATLRELWLGERLRPSDLMAWNTDATRMPAAMHSEYLRRCYLRNELAESRYPVEGRPVSLADIRQPIFLVGTEKDHVSPWRSVYKLHRLADAEITFALTNGGHNAGIVSEPGHPGRHFALRTRAAGDPWVPPESWAEGASRHDGSWWPAWHAWMLARGSGRQVPARVVPKVNGLPAAPGEHVLLRYHD